MSKTQKEQTVTVDDKTYNVSDLNETQITLVNHVAEPDGPFSIKSPTTPLISGELQSVTQWAAESRLQYGELRIPMAK